MSNNLHIREFDYKDAVKVLEIFKQNVPKYFAVSEVQEFEKYLEFEIENYFVAEIEGEIIGAGGVNFEKNKTIGKISWGFIKPEFQGFGFGSKLLKYRIDFLKSVTTVEKIALGTSQHTYMFYQKNGFVLKEIRKDYWAKDFDLYDMIYDIEI
jgi:N-acetylglutamate synthase-like GNAT family acetyltransferase